MAGLMRGVARLWSLGMIGLLSVVAGACNGLFYYPDSGMRLSPAQLGLAYEAHGVQTADGVTLALWHLHAVGAERPPIIVHFHGNAENMSTHVWFVAWLAEAGYDVITFDYRGYGESGGAPSRQGLIADGRAVLSWVRQRFPDRPLFVFGQSLGGAVAIPVVAELPPGAVRGVVIESSFASYRGMARAVLRRFWLSWPLQVPLSYLVTDDWRPAEALAALRMPVLVVHGTLDPVVPEAQGRELYSHYKGPDGDFWSIPGAGHTAAFAAEDSPWRTRFLEWLGRRR